MSHESTPRVSVQPSENGPFVVKHLERLSNRHGPLETKASLALCLCGGSKNKPFCDGSHWHNGFKDDRN